MNNSTKGMYVVARYLVAFLIIVYGFAKLNGAQFTTMDSELDKPMRDVSGFTLTWYYFGYSRFYGSFIALIQVMGGVLLMFRRTTLLGSCLLIPVIGNIILIDIFYGVHASALVVALIILCALLFIVANHFRELVDILWVRQNSHFPKAKRHGLVLAAKGLVCLLLILMPYGITYWAANYNNRRPTPIDGTWSLVEHSPDLEESEVPSFIFFEHNAARMVVFKYGPEKYEQHDFQVDPAVRTITIWETWLTRGEEIFDGKYELSDTQLTLQGRFAHHDQESTLRLLKRR